MKNATLLKTASLFFFLLTAQFSYGQLICSDYPDWVSQAGSVGDQVHYQGSIYQNRYGNGLNPPVSWNVDPSCSSGGANWCFVGDCSSTLSLPQSHDFNSGAESWISGGSKAQLLDVTQLENQGWATNGTNFIDYNNNSCNNLTGNVFVLRGSDSTDRILTSPSYAMSGYDSVIFDYDYFVESMDSSTEGWNLDYSNDSGNTWTTVKSYRRDTDFDNLDCGPNDYGNKEVVILDDATYSFTDQSKFRMYTERDDGNVGSWDYLVIDNVTITGIITSTCSASGTILMERYDGISGTSIANLTGSANYPENPSSDAQLTSFEIPTNAANNYGARVSGYICAPQTGYYTFWIASDDNGQLNLSTDDDPANKTTISWVDSWTSSREWDKFTTQKSDRILLVMGESYYVEALMKEGGGGDNLAVGWSKPGEPSNIPSEVIPGSVLSPMVYCPTASFTASGTSVETGEGITFTNTTTGTSPTHSWDFGDGTTSIATSPTHQYASAGTYTVTLTATNSCGSDTATTTITVNFGTDILFSEDQADASQSGSTISGSGTSATNASGITWTMNDPGGDVKVHQGDHIHCSKLDGDTVTWETEDIIISGYTNLNFTVFARKIEDFGSSDYIKLQYSIDGGTTRVNIATYNTNLTNANIGGDINTLTSTTVAGDTLKIYIEVYIDDDDQKFEWEDITLTGTPFYNVWQGTNIDLVTDTAKWSKGSQPTAASNVWIPNTKHLKLTDDQEYNTVNARATSQLTIEKTGSLKTVGDFTKIAGTGTVTLNSDATEFASIVVGGTATGNITYNRWVNKTGPFEGNNWDFVGSPVKNQRIDNFVSANSGVLPNSGDIYGIAKYFNEWDSWEWYTDSNIGDDIFNTGESYYTSTIVTGDASGATLAFTGEIPTGTQTKEIINNNGTNTIGRRWEMVANPYASYIHGNPASGDAVNNFVKVNLDLNLLEPSFGAIYAWNGTGGYTIYNLSQINTATIAPGQGFWIAARQGTPQQLQFTPAMQTVEGGDDFISGAPILLNYMLNLKLYHGTTEKAKTSFYFQQGLTDGLDTGYDAGALEQTQAISSRLTENDQGYNMSINAMSIETVYNQSIPLVINQQEGQPFRVSISENTIPEEVNVYLEDVLNGTLTSLKDQDFELSAQSDLSEDGRFYIRFTTESLAINDVLSPSNVTVFKLNTDAFVTITGLSPEMGKTTATLYNMLGMKVREKALNNTAATQQISTQGLASGVYIINLKAGEQAVSKKIIIQ